MPIVKHGSGDVIETEVEPQEPDGEAREGEEGEG